VKARSPEFNPQYLLGVGWGKSYIFNQGLISRTYKNPKNTTRKQKQIIQLKNGHRG
jgi:hypothetical protein